MFGGLARREVRLAMGLTLAFVGGAICANWLRTPNPVPSVPAAVPAPLRTPADPAPGPAPSGTRVARIDGQIDLNEASTEQLAALPAIGPAKAEAIVKHRDAAGGFATIDDLDAVPGIGKKTVEQLRPFLMIARPAARTTAREQAREVPAATPAPMASPIPAVVRLNSAGREELMTLDGVGEKIADRIISDRVTRGRYRTIEDLARVRGIGPSIIERNRQRMVLD